MLDTTEYTDLHAVAAQVLNTDKQLVSSCNVHGRHPEVAEELAIALAIAIAS